MVRGRAQRSSPSVSMVMMKGVSAVARMMRGDCCGACRPLAHDLGERFLVHGEDLLVAVLARHEALTALTRLAPEGVIAEERLDRWRHPFRGTGHEAESF